MTSQQQQQPEDEVQGPLESDSSSEKELVEAKDPTVQLLLKATLELQLERALTAELFAKVELTKLDHRKLKEEISVLKTRLREQSSAKYGGCPVVRDSMGRSYYINGNNTKTYLNKDLF